jgi:hypothetical protein
MTATVEQTDEFLAHFGVVGMKWGKHKAKSDSGGSSSGGAAEKSGPTRRDLKTLDKASKKADQQAHNAKIDKARAEYDANARKNYLDAKAQYKIDKATIGKREATKAFNKVKDKNLADAEIANQAKYGKERTTALLVSAGSVVLSGVLAGLSEH